MIKPERDFKLKKVTLAEIDQDNRDFCFHFFRTPSEHLLDSIRYFGVISPPLLRIRGNTCQILNGFKRIESARICHMEKISCKVCEASIMEWDMIRFLISLFTSDGPPNILDQATLLHKMSGFFDQDEIVKDVLPLLGLPPTPKVLQRLLPLSGMDETLGKALLDGMINQDMALRLMAFEPEARIRIGSLFLYYGYSQSKQFEILEYLMDICGKENRSFTEILKEMGWVKNMPQNTSKNRVTEGEVFRQRLRERRNPILSNLERAWEDKVKSLHLPPALSLNPPPYFEGSTFRLSLTFKDLEEFKKKIGELKALGETDAWIELFSK